MGLNREGTTQSGGGGGLSEGSVLEGMAYLVKWRRFREGGAHYSCKMEDSSEGGAYQRERIMRDIRWGLIRGA